MSRLTEWAYPLAESVLAEPLPRRWKHCLGVAERARTIALVLGEDADLLEAAAVLHDIGYAPDLAKTGFHPLDGARYLRDVANADQRVINLVAHHSCSWLVAEARGSVAGQVRLMLRFIEKAGLVEVMRACDWRNFARRYNGPAFARNNYDTRMAAAYQRWLKQLGTFKSAA